MAEPATNIVRLKQWMVERLQGFVDARAIPDLSPETLKVLSMRFDELCQHAQIQLPESQARQLLAEVVNDLEPRLKAHGVTLPASTFMKSVPGGGQWNR